MEPGEYRFTLAHEIAHSAFFEGKEPPRRVAGLVSGDRAEEALCDEIALEVLVPLELLKSKMERFRGRGLTCGRLLELAFLFGVPLWAMAQRVTECRDDYGFLMWKEMVAGKEGLKKLRVLWAKTPSRLYVPRMASNAAPDAGLIVMVFRRGIDSRDAGDAETQVVGGRSASGYESYNVGGLRGQYFTHCVWMKSKPEEELLVFCVIVLEDRKSVLDRMK